MSAHRIAVIIKRDSAGYPAVDEVIVDRDPRELEVAVVWDYPAFFPKNEHRAIDFVEAGQIRRVTGDFHQAKVDSLIHDIFATIDFANDADAEREASAIAEDANALTLDVELGANGLIEIDLADRYDAIRRCADIGSVHINVVGNERVAYSGDQLDEICDDVAAKLRKGAVTGPSVREGGRLKAAHKLNELLTIVNIAKGLSQTAPIGDIELLARQALTQLQS